MEPIGNKVLDLAANARSRIVLVAPFQKVATLKAVLDVVQPQVEVICVTRWRPEEIAKGVSDLECWPILRDRGAVMRLRFDLHAKVYQSDDLCLVGSANLTHAGLGWAASSNLELLIQASRRDPDMVDFFEELFSSTTVVTDTIHANMKALVDGIDCNQILFTSPNEESTERHGIGRWVPCCHHPENRNIYHSYRGMEDRVIGTTFEAAKQDLESLGIPSGIRREATFNQYVAGILRQSPIVAAIDIAAVNGVSMAAGQFLVADRLTFGTKAPSIELTGNEWSALKSWLLYFLPNRYRERQTSYGPEFLINNIIG